MGLPAMDFKVRAAKYRRPITFALAGGINTGIDLAVFSLLLLAGAVSPALAQAGGYTAGLVSSFFFNKHLTFQNRAEGLRQGVLFLLVNAVTLLIGIGAICFFHNLIGLQEHIAKLLLVTPITMTLNYLGYKKVVFVR